MFSDPGHVYRMHTHEDRLAAIRASAKSRQDITVPLDTHEERMNAIEALPFALKYALEGNGYYADYVLKASTGLATWFLCPWMWYN